MTTTECRNIVVLHSAVPQVEDDDGQPALDILDILSGQDSVDISHVGGEFADFLAFGDDLLGPSAWYVLYLSTLACKINVFTSRPLIRDYRTHRNRAQCRADSFALQLPSMVRAYMDWMLQMGDTGLAGNYSLPPNADIQGESQLKVVDILSM